MPARCFLPRVQTRRDGEATVLSPSSLWDAPCLRQCDRALLTRAMSRLACSFAPCSLSPMAVAAKYSFAARPTRLSHNLSFGLRVEDRLLPHSLHLGVDPKGSPERISRHPCHFKLPPVVQIELRAFPIVIAKKHVAAKPLRTALPAYRGKRESVMSSPRTREAAPARQHRASSGYRLSSPFAARLSRIMMMRRLLRARSIGHLIASETMPNAEAELLCSRITFIIASDVRWYCTTILRSSTSTIWVKV